MPATRSSSSRWRCWCWRWSTRRCSVAGRCIGPRPTASCRIGAAASLVLWIGVLVCGRFDRVVGWMKDYARRVLREPFATAAPCRGVGRDRLGLAVAEAVSDRDVRAGLFFVGKGGHRRRGVDPDNRRFGEKVSAAQTVSVLLPVAVAGTYSYGVPAGLTVAPGDIVAVPLGTRDVIGVVWDDPPDAGDRPQPASADRREARRAAAAQGPARLRRLDRRLHADDAGDGAAHGAAGARRARTRAADRRGAARRAAAGADDAGAAAGAGDARGRAGVVEIGAGGRRGGQHRRRRRAGRGGDAGAGRDAGAAGGAAAGHPSRGAGAQRRAAGGGGRHCAGRSPPAASR